eukprot:scaffold294381_cov37-Prasinocladus_malaysianus.AAC.1
MPGLNAPAEERRAAFNDIAKLTSLPAMPTHPHPHLSNDVDAATQSATVTIKRRPYICKAKSAHDLLDRAMERIGNSLFLNRERLDHFFGADKFDMVRPPRHEQTIPYTVFSSLHRKNTQQSIFRLL